MRRKQLLAGLAVIAVAALAGACGPAAAHGHSSSTAQSLKPAATDASPQSVLQGVLSSLNSSSIQNASFGVPADGAPQDGNWLYVEISADGTGPATMPGYFDSLVLIGAYDVAAQQQGVSVATGSEVYTAAASGCSTPQDESCNSLEAGADVIAPSVYTPTSNDASALDGQIRDGLAKAGFDAISISFMKPLDSLIPPEQPVRPTTRAKDGNGFGTRCLGRIATTRRTTSKSTIRAVTLWRSPLSRTTSARG